MSKQIVEIKGVKLEVDMRTAKTIDTFKVGDRVKVLIKQYSNYKSLPGIIVGFDAFEKLPTIIVLTFNPSAYSSQPLELHYINAQSENVELCMDASNIPIDIDHADIIDRLNKEIEKKQIEIDETVRQREYFKAMYGMYFDNPLKEDQEESCETPTK